MPVSKNSINCFPFFVFSFPCVCLSLTMFVWKDVVYSLSYHQFVFTLCLNGNGGPVHIHHLEHHHVPTVLMCFVVYSIPWYMSIVVIVRDHDRHPHQRIVAWHDHNVARYVVTSSFSSSFFLGCGVEVAIVMVQSIVGRRQTNDAKRYDVCLGHGYDA